MEDLNRKLSLQILIYTNRASVYIKMSNGTEVKQLQEQIALSKQENKQLRDTLEQLAVIIKMSIIQFFNIFLQARKLLADYSLGINSIQ